MERIKRIILILLITLCFTGGQLAADCDEMTMLQLTTPQSVSYDDCTKDYNISAEKLFYLTLASISANKFDVKEMQSKTGYILFRAANRDFLATVVYYSLSKSMLKITPANNNYYFPPGIVTNIFKYIDLNMEKPIEPIKKS